MRAAARARGRSTSCLSRRARGASLEAPSLVTLAPGGRASFPVAASATAQAAAGDDYGFLVLRRGAVTRRIPYAFFVTRPALQDVAADQAPQVPERHDCRGRVAGRAYRWPAAPFGYPPILTDPPVVEDGAERVYLVPHLDRPVVNLGVSVVSATSGAVIDPVAPRLARRERRAGRGGDSGRRQSADVRLRARDRSGRNASSRDSSATTSRSTRRRTSTRASRFAGGTACATGSTTSARRGSGCSRTASQPAVRRSPCGPRTAARGSIPTRSSRLQGAVHRRDRLRLELRRRRLRAAILGAAAATRADARDLRRIGLPGGEEHHDLRPERDAEHELPRRADPSGARDDGDVAPASRAAAACAGTRRCSSWRTRPASIRAVRFLDGGRRIKTVRKGVSGLYSATWRSRTARHGRHRLRAVVDSASRPDVVASRIVRVCK